MKLMLFSLIMAFDNALGVSQGTAVNPEFRPYIEAYRALKKQNGLGDSIQDINIVFKNDMPKTMLGLCEVYASIPVKRTIYINPLFWNIKGFNETNKFELIMHEMIHCDLEYFKHDHGGIMDAMHQDYGNMSKIHKEFTKFIKVYKK